MHCCIHVSSEDPSFPNIFETTGAYPFLTIIRNNLLHTIYDSKLGNKTTTLHNNRQRQSNVLHSTYLWSVKSPLWLRGVMYAGAKVLWRPGYTLAISSRSLDGRWAGYKSVRQSRVGSVPEQDYYLISLTFGREAVIRPNCSFQAFCATATETVYCIWEVDLDCDASCPASTSLPQALAVERPNSYRPHRGMD